MRARIIKSALVLSTALLQRSSPAAAFRHSFSLSSNSVTSRRLISSTSAIWMKDGKGKTVAKNNLPSKDCVVCGRPFTWRKKWERCWDDVTTCSKSCNAQRKRGELADGVDDPGAASAKRKSARKAKREGTADPALFSKPCTICNTPSDLLIRCQVDSSKEWNMVCKGCWPSVSGGVTDGDADHPHYRYGGLWKNRYAAAP